MSLLHLSTGATRPVAASRAAAPGLRGRWLVIVRVIWLALATLTLLLFVVNIPIYMQLQQTVCTRPTTCPNWQPTPETVAGLQHLHFSLNDYARFNLIITLISALAWVGIAILLFWRKSNEWAGLIFSLQGVLQGVIGPNDFLGSLTYGHSIWQIPALGINTLDNTLLWLALALFPNGRFLPRWTLWAIPIYTAIEIAATLWPDFFAHTGPLGGIFFFLTTGSLLGAQIYRYARISSPTERQQTKWVVFSLATVIAIQLGVAIPQAIFPELNQPGSLYSISANTVDILVLLIPPPAIAIALLRYRLWDVDVLINRSLVYGALTVLLALVYGGLVFLLEKLLGGLISPDNDVALVISTLAIAALFQPLRRASQNLIDRRFYRRRYDASKTVAEFTAALHHDLDLAQLSEHLLDTVQETMQPAHVSLWLCKREPEQRSLSPD